MAVAALEVSELTFAYPGGEPVLKGISFTIAPGERVALLGANGAGKSTLLWCLVGILRAEGRVMAGGIPLADGSLGEFRRKVGLAFSEPEDQLFMPTIQRDIMFGPLAAGQPPEAAEETMRTALQRVGLSPELLARPPHELSSGERRRAALAAVLALDPAVLALDEPTNSLDAPGRAALARTLTRLDCAQIIATHDLAFAEAVCRRALVLHRGELVCDLAMSRALQDDGMLREYGLIGEVTGENGQAIIL